MNKFVQIRNLEDAKHRKLKSRAADRGLSISDYVKRLIDNDLAKPSWEEIARQMDKLSPVRLPESSADIIRRERDSR
jgi:plasmid stability protein